MKRTMILCLSILLLVSLNLLPQHAGRAQEETGEIILDYSFEMPTAKSGFQELYQLITIPGMGRYAPPGKPLIPMKTAKILVPYGREVEHIEVIPGEKVYLGKFYIQPGQRAIRIGDNQTEATPPDKMIYDSMKLYPEMPFSKVGIQWKTGYQILIVNLFPVEYTPKSMDVSYFESLKVIVKTKHAGAGTEGLFRHLPRDAEAVGAIVDNPREIETYASEGETSIDLFTASKLLPTPTEDAFDYQGNYIISPDELTTDEAAALTYVQRYAEEQKVSPALLMAIVRQESNFHPNAVGDGGLAIGYMQPHWDAAYDAGYRSARGDSTDYAKEDWPTDGLDPDTNIKYGCGYLKIVHGLFGSGAPYYDSLKNAVSAYNLGRTHGPDKSNENSYVNPVLEYYEEYKGKYVPLYDYVIITSEELKNAPEPNFQTLADWKESRGIATQIVTVEDIYANYPGVDNQEKIRNFIRDAYLNNGIEYVLLGGDADGADVGGESGDNIVPVRGLWAWDYECELPNIPADLYYACLDGSYDSNGNGIYGEPDDGPNGEDIDLLAEVYIGRAPVDSAAELSNFVTKTISYESSTSDAYLKEAWMVGEKLAEDSDCAVEEAIHQRNVANTEGILNLLRKFRDEAVKEEYVKLYYEYSPDVREILIREPKLAIEAATLIIKYAPAIEYLIRGENGEDVSITDEDVEKVTSFMERLKYEVNSRKEEIGRQRSSELIKLLEEFEEQTERAKGKSFSSAFQSSIYSGSGGTAMGGETWGGDYNDEIKDGSSSHGYHTEGFPDTYSKSTLYDRDYSDNDWPKSEIINAIDSNIHVVNHMGHSSVTYVMKMYNSDVDGLTNDKYFFGYSQGCYAGSFDNRDAPPPYGSGNYLSDDCVAEHLVVNPTGAVAFISNSRFGWFRKGGTDGPSQYYDRQFWDAIFGEGITNIGRANQDSKEDNIGYVSSGVMRFCYYEINLLGDPETQFWVPPSEHDIAVVNIDAPETADAGVPVSITATIKNNGQSDESSIEVQLLEDGVVKDATAIDNIQSGASAEVNFTWSSDVQGEHTLKAYAVPLPEEENTGNNYRERVIAVVGTLRVDDDGAQCPTADFADIQEAIDSIASGATVMVFPGSYERVVINKSINLIGVDMPVINAAGTGNVVEIQANSVTLQGFKIQNSGIDHNAGIMIRSNNNLIKGTLLVSNQAGIALIDASNNKILENTLYANECGVGIESYSSNNHISFNNISSNNYGVYGYSSEVTSPSTILPNTISYNNFVDNTQNAYDDMQNNKWQRNYWSDYAGDDIDGDGIGDSSHEIAGGAGANDSYPAMSPQVMAEVSIDAPDEVGANSDFVATVNIGDVLQFDACNYDVCFDTSVLRLDDVTSGLIDSTTIPIDIYNEISSGTYRITQNVPGLSGVTGSGYLVVLHFHVIGSGGDSSTISLSNGILYDKSSQEILATWVGDSVHVALGPFSYDLTLVSGWNLISLPLIPDDSDIPVVISADTLASGNVSSIGIIRAYDPATGDFPHYIPESASGDLAAIEDGCGYWVFMNEDDTLTVTGTQWPAPPEVPSSYDVVVGWNLIGFKSLVNLGDDAYLANIEGTYPVIWSYDAVGGAYSNVKDVEDGMEVGHGFWLWATEAGTIVPPE